MTKAEAVNWLINITADIGKAEHRDLWHYEQALSEIRDMLESAQPDRKKGKWKRAYLDHEAMGERPSILYCSICGQCIAYPTNFCPTCGADMRGEEDE